MVSTMLIYFRPWAYVRGFSRETVVEITTNVEARNTDAGRTTSLGMLSTPELGELMTWRISSQSSTAFSGQFLQLSSSEKCGIRL